MNREEVDKTDDVDEEDFGNLEKKIMSYKAMIRDFETQNAKDKENIALSISKVTAEKEENENKILELNSKNLALEKELKHLKRQSIDLETHFNFNVKDILEVVTKYQQLLLTNIRKYPKKSNKRPSSSFSESLDSLTRLSWATYSDAKFKQPRLAVVSMHSNKN